MRASPAPEIPLAGAFDPGRLVMSEKYQTKPNNPYGCYIFHFTNVQFVLKNHQNVVSRASFGAGPSAFAKIAIRQNKATKCPPMLRFSRLPSI